MGWDFSDWLRQHRTTVEGRWLSRLRGLPAYTSVTLEGAVSRWGALLDGLLEDRVDTLKEQVRVWADRELQEHGSTPPELLVIAQGLSDTIREMLPEDRLWQGNTRLGGLDTALVHYLAREVERLGHEKSQLETVQEITQELSVNLDLDRMLHKTLLALAEAIGAEMGAVFLVDSAVGTLTPKATLEWDDETGAQVPLAALPSDWRLGQSEHGLVLRDLEAERPAPWVEMMVIPQARSLVAAPLIANGAFIGLLIVASPRLDAFDRAQVGLFHSVLSQVATAISNAEVYHLITHQAHELGQMLRHQQEQSSRNQSILASIGDGVVMNSSEGKTIMVNPAAQRILEMSADELIDHDARTLFSAFDAKGQEEAIAAMETLLASSTSELHKAFKMMLEVDRRVVHAHLSPVRTERGDFLGVVTVLRDITREVEADRTKSEFVSNVSHELRTPMTAIKGYADLLHAGAVGPINEAQQKFVGIIRNNADRLTALINDLLDISRVETGRVRFEPRPLQIGEVVADVVNSLAVPAESKDHTLSYEVAGGLPEVMGDRDRLNQVLTNLVSNAIRYTPEGGSIDVRAYPVEGAVRVDVTDSGIGIAPEDLGRIFERFYRADDPLVQEAAGTGLGLSITKMFVEMHGGRVWVESEPGKGSTFTFILPMLGQEAEIETEVGRSGKRLVARARRILVVDDDPDVSKLVKMQLEREGYLVSVLSRGSSVVAWVEEHQPDLILLDLILPDMDDMDGLDVLRSLRQLPTTADIPVIVLSIAQDDGTAWELAIEDYLTKPVNSEALLHSIEKALAWQGRVLIVEDDPDTLGMLSATMRQIGFTPLVAGDGYEALTLARRHRPDLILLDLWLPGMNGYETLSHLKRDAVTQTIPIVAMSAHVADVDHERNRLIALGASSFLLKPFSVEDLLAEAEAALQPLSAPSSS
jgi:PAS domain S-box-containing protein